MRSSPKTASPVIVNFFYDLGVNVKKQSKLTITDRIIKFELNTEQIIFVKSEEGQPLVMK